MHFQYIRPGGLWGMFTLLTSAAVQLIDQQLFKAINGDDGGTWAPTSVITLGGAGVHVTGPLVADNLSGHVTLGNTLTVDFGAVLDLAGVERVEPGARVAVFGQPFNPGTLTLNEWSAMVLASPQDPGALGGSLFAFPGSLVDVMGTTLFESGSSWAMLGGSTGYVLGGALLNVAGVNASSLMANVAFWQYSQAVFLAGSRAVFLNSALVIGAGAAIQVQDVLEFVPGSHIKGDTTITDDALIILASSSPAHPVTMTFGHYATLDFGALSAITGSPVVNGPSRFNDKVELNGDVLLDPGHTMTLAWGSSLVNAAATTRTAPEDRIGANAITGERMARGPDGPWTIDAEAWDWVIIPPQSHANTVWMLAIPKNQNRAIAITITAATSAINNNLFLGWVGSTEPLARFMNDSTRPPGSVTLGWDCDYKVWRVRSSTTVESTASALKIPQ